jgi:hypothetical protein
MKAKDLFPSCMEDDFFDAGTLGYESILALFGQEVVDQRIGSHQGDTLVLLKQPGSEVYGYLCFGWGSCSYCDALQSCKSYEDLDELIESLRAMVIWKNAHDMKKFFLEHDWKGDYQGSEPEQKEFVDNVLRYFSYLRDNE